MHHIYTMAKNIVFFLDLNNFLMFRDIGDRIFVPPKK